MCFASGWTLIWAKQKYIFICFADLDKPKPVTTVDKETTDRLIIFGRVLYWIHLNLDE